MTCPKGHKRIIGIEYYWESPMHYDGVSEIKCLTCNKRYGRWTGKILKDGELEPPFGEKRD